MIEIRRGSLTEELKKEIFEGFSRHSLAMTGHDEKFEPVSFLAIENDMMIGALVVELFWGALHIKYLYIKENYRNLGLAKRLIAEAILYGQKNKCPFAFVETMSFQALDFYQKIGFNLEYTRSGYSHNTSFHYLKKIL